MHGLEVTALYEIVSFPCIMMRGHMKEVAMGYNSHVHLVASLKC